MKRLLKQSLPLLMATGTAYVTGLWYTTFPIWATGVILIIVGYTVGAYVAERQK